MKDKFTTEADLTAIEIKAEQQQEYTWQGFTTLQPGQKLWCFNMTTQELAPVNLVKDKTFDMSTGDKVQASKVTTGKHLIYVAAINKKNAMRKVLLQFGWRWDNKLKTGVPMFEEIKLEPEVIEINKPTKEQTMSIHSNFEEIKKAALFYANQHQCNYNVILLNGSPEGEFVKGESSYEYVTNSYFEKERPHAKIIYKTDDALPGAHLRPLRNDDVDCIPDNKESFENDGAYADDDKE